MDAIIFDTETTGTGDDDEIIQSAWLGINIDGTQLSKFNSYYRPDKKISLGAQATHHILEEELTAMSIPPSSDCQIPEGVKYIIGHNIDFDWKMIGRPEVKRICTLAMSRALWPEFDSHSQSAVIYGICSITGMRKQFIKSRLTKAHDAANDIEICALILDIIIKTTKVETWDQLHEFSEKSRIPTVMPFGKHKGLAIKDVPRDYISWLIRQPDVDPYLMQALTGKQPGNRLF